MSAVSCPTQKLCVAVDATGNAVTSTNPTDGAGAWRTTTIAQGTYHGGLYDVSCASASLCVAGGSWGNGPFGYGNAGNMVTTTDPTGGAPAWHPIAVGPSTDYGYGYVGPVSCTAPSLCLAVAQLGGPGSAEVFTSKHPTGGAGAWAATRLNLAPNASLTGASCPTASRCVLIDSAGNVIVSNDPTGGPRTWRTTNVATAEGLVGIACPSSTLCLALGRDWRLYVGHVSPIPPLVAQVRAQLRKDLVPTARPKISQIVKNHGFTQQLTALSAGVAQIAWYYVPKGAHLARQTSGPPLVAIGNKTLPRAGRATLHIRLTTTGENLLKKVRRLTIMVEGSFVRPHRPAVTARKTFLLTS